MFATVGSDRARGGLFPAVAARNPQIHTRTSLLPPLTKLAVRPGFATAQKKFSHPSRHFAIQMRRGLSGRIGLAFERIRTMSAHK
jgi:hypothetical protein